MWFNLQLVRFTPPRELTPPPVHQEDFKSYQSITLSSGPNTTGPASPASQSQPGWSPSIVGPRHQTPQNHSSKKSTSSGPQQSKRGTAGAAYRVQSTSPSPQGVNAAYRKNQPTMGATYNPVQPETTMKSSAVLIFRPSWAMNYSATEWQTIVSLQLYAYRRNHVFNVSCWSKILFYYF